jgi:hypothetical protein
MHVRRYLPFGRSYLRDGLVVVCAVLAQPSVPWFLAGAVLFLAGLASRLWSKGILRRNAAVTATGPYALCRHPFYAANLALDLSLCLLAGRPGLMLLYAPIFLLAYFPTMRREESSLSKRFGESYARYRRRTPRFVPRRPRQWAHLRGDWRFAGLLREREVSRTLRLLALPFVFLWAGQVRNGWWEILEFESLALLATAGLLHLAGRLVYQTYEGRRPGRPRRHVWGGGGALAAVLLFGALLGGPQYRLHPAHGKWV